MMSRFRHCLALLCLLLAPPLQAGQSAADSHQGIWILVDTAKARIEVLDGGTVLAAYDDIAIGRNGAGVNKRRNDEKTPLGHFRIAWISAKTRFHRFFGLDYPNLAYAKRALTKGLINRRQFNAIRHNLAAGEPPPQNTRLGGQIGLHGVGAGSVKVHHEFNWTEGCIALTNEQIDDLWRFAAVGTPVEIR